MAKGINKIESAIMVCGLLALIIAISVNLPTANGVTLEAGGVQMTLDLADTGLQLRFASTG